MDEGQVYTYKLLGISVNTADVLLFLSFLKDGIFYQDGGSYKISNTEKYRDLISTFGIYNVCVNKHDCENCDKIDICRVKGVTAL